MAEINIGALPDKSQDPEQLLLESRAEESEFEKLMPKTGFFAKYIEHTLISEPPLSYHFWTAMAVMSAVVQRNTWLSKGIYRVYPNLYIVFVAPSGKCRKTGAILTGEKLVQHLDFINIIADKTTPEALLEALDRVDISPNPTGKSVNMNITSTGFIKSKEMSTFLNKNTYSSGLVTILTDLYDCPDSFRYLTRNSKPIELTDVHVTMLAATTPEWLATNLPEAAFEGGFMSRVIWCVKHWRDRVIAIQEEPDPAEMAGLVKMVTYINDKHQGPMKFSADAKAWYIKWYESSALQAADDEKLSGFHERLPDTIIKVAILLQAADTPGKMLLKLSYLKQAEKILRWTQTKMYAAFETTELSRLGQLRRRINTFLDHYGEITRRDVLRKVAGRLDYKGQLDDVEQLMVDAGELIVERIESTGGRPKVIYRRPTQQEQKNGQTVTIK